MLLGLASYYKRIANADLNSGVEEARAENLSATRRSSQAWPPSFSSGSVPRSASIAARNSSERRVARPGVFSATAPLRIMDALRFRAFRARVLQTLGILRWSGIALFGVTILKVLTLDMAHLDSLYRVVAIFVLAAAIFMASGAYWRRRAK